jgi:hypothetical protein
MVQATIRRFGAIRALVLVGLLGIALIASTAVPAVGSSNTWTPTGNMTNARTHHTAVKCWLPGAATPQFSPAPNSITRLRASGLPRAA